MIQATLYLTIYNVNKLQAGSGGKVGIDPMWRVYKMAIRFSPEVPSLLAGWLYRKSASLEVSGSGIDLPTISHISKRNAIAGWCWRKSRCRSSSEGPKKIRAVSNRSSIGYRVDLQEKCVNASISGSMKNCVGLTIRTLFHFRTVLEAKYV